MASPLVFKAGCGVQGDVSKLCAHHPAAFSLVRSCLDLSVVWRGTESDKRTTQGFRKRAAEVSLSRLSELVLGKAMDKSQQVSDWGRRPLSLAQLQYAALDGECLAPGRRKCSCACLPACRRLAVAYPHLTPPPLPRRPPRSSCRDIDL